MQELWLALTLSLAASPPEEASVQRVPEATVQFDLGSAAVDRTDRTRLLIQARRLGDDPRDILVVGHADPSGSETKNEDLSRRRASAVARIFVAAGVPARRIQELGAGISDPAAGSVAAAVHRRVEVWLIGPTQVGWVSWRHRRVEARTPERSWFDAALQLPLEADDRVRTRARSAGEITFRRGYVLYLGPNGSLTVFAARRRSSKRRADVHLEEGSLLARLAETTAPPLSVSTEAAQIRGRARDVEIRHDQLAETSLVSVFDGSVDVSAEGKTVQVRRGFGTRVERGLPPEAPTRLPPPPEWASGRPRIEVIDPDRPGVRVTWRTLSPRTRLEATSPDDPSFRKVRLTSTVKGDEGRLPLEPGLHLIRASSIDEKGLVGRAGAAREVVVVSAPNGLAREGEVWVREGPGTIEVPEGMALQPREDGTPDLGPAKPGRLGLRWSRRLDLDVGRHPLELVVEGLASLHAVPFTVVVRSHRLVENDSTPEIVRLVLQDHGGRPLPIPGRLQYRAIGPEVRPCGPDDGPAMVPCAPSRAGFPLEPKSDAIEVPRTSVARRVIVFDPATHYGRTLVVAARSEVSASQPESAR
ncbi:MAG: OmpA family protein [Myxococcota bacterium]